MLQLRARVNDALSGSDFMLDCIEHELDLLASGCLRFGLEPFFIEPATGIRFAFVYWRPGETTGPHEHTAWSVSAVCHNRLDVETFDREQSYRRRELVPKNLFQAVAGEVGYMYGPAIHSPINTSNEWSLSVHVSSARDSDPTGDEPLPALSPPLPPDPGNLPPIVWIHRERARRQEADLLAKLLLARPSPRGRELLARCTRLTSSEMMHALTRTSDEPRLRLARVHPDAQFTVERIESDCRVVVESPAGPVELFRINDLAYEALSFASATATFEASALPGGLTTEEQVALVDMLGDVGLVRRIDA